jgi:hypothetical protein
MMGSFDCDQQMFEKFLSLIPSELAKDMREALKRQPYHFHFYERRVCVTIVSKRGNRKFVKAEEEFIPFNVVDFKSA